LVPCESDADFAQTLRVCDAAAFERVHGFPFSPRPGTAAAQLKPLNRAIVQQRNRILIEHCRTVADQAWPRFLGRTALALIEEQEVISGVQEDAAWLGHGEAYQIVRVDLPLNHALAARDLTAVWSGAPSFIQCW